jgi:hypothetical protein
VRKSSNTGSSDQCSIPTLHIPLWLTHADYTHHPFYDRLLQALDSPVSTTTASGLPALNTLIEESAAPLQRTGRVAQGEDLVPQDRVTRQRYQLAPPESLQPPAIREQSPASLPGAATIRATSSTAPADASMLDRRSLATSM